MRKRRRFFSHIGLSDTRSRKIEAYCAGLSYPPAEKCRRQGDRWFSTAKNTASVKICFSDDTWQVIFRRELVEHRTRDGDSYFEEFMPEMARVILEHHLGYAVSGELAEELVNMPGQSLMRIEPAALERFRRLL